jgi:HTH-type transcriptional regulator/antitoxin HipB
MNKKTKPEGLKLTTLDELLDEHYGIIGTEKRTKFECESKLFMIGVMIKEERKLKSMTKAQLAKKTGIKKSVISKIENEQGDLKLSTIYKLIEFGLGRKVRLSIE